MSTIRTTLLPQSTILRMYSERNAIQVDPEYQRMSEVWTEEKRQLLIDSLLNDFDLPKIYFHEFLSGKTLADGRKVKYSIIDGRQRLETIWKFIDGDFPLGDDFKLFADPSVDAKGMTYSELAQNHPLLRIRFDSYSLPIYVISTDDLDLIEEMFLRLNEAVPLNAAEKRNAFGGPVAKAIREVSAHPFFVKKVRFSNKRYQFREMAARMMFLSTTLEIVDTKKAYLDTFVKSFKNAKDRERKQIQNLQDSVESILEKMAKIFTDKDPLLSTQSMPVIYFLIYRAALSQGWASSVTRNLFLEFDKKRKENREIAETEIAAANYDLLEFDRMSLQGTSDALSINFRFNVLRKFILATALEQGNNLKSAYLEGVNFDNYFLKNFNLSMLSMQGSSFKNASLIGASFSSALLTRANFDMAMASLADYSYTDLTGATFFGADITGANFLEANLENANFIFARLDKTNFEGANLKDARFDDINAKVANLSPAQRKQINVEKQVEIGKIVFQQARRKQ